MKPEYNIILCRWSWHRILAKEKKKNCKKNSHESFFNYNSYTYSILLFILTPDPWLIAFFLKIDIDPKITFWQRRIEWHENVHVACFITTESIYLYFILLALYYYYSAFHLNMVSHSLFLFRP